MRGLRSYRRAPVPALPVLLRDPLFRRFWVAGLAFQLGTWSLHVTMLIHVYQVTGSPVATGLIPVCAAAPSVLLGPVAGLVVDRHDRARVMALASAAMVGLLLICGPVALGLGEAGPVAVALPFAVIAIEATLFAFFSPAENAVLPRLAPAARLGQANALNALNDGLGRIAGPGIGAGLLVALGFGAAMLACAVLFAVAAAVLAGLRVPAARDDTAMSGATGQGAAATAWRDLLAGARLVAAMPVLALTVAAWALFLLADVPLSAVLPAFILGSLGATAGAMGGSMVWRGVTGLLGGVLIAAIAPRVSEVRLLAWGLATFGASIALMGAAQSFWVMVLLSVPIGPATAAIQTGLLTLTQRAAPDQLRGRVFALVGMVNGVITIGASASGGALGSAIGVPTVVVLSGALQLLPLAVVLLWLRPALRHRAGAAAA